MNNEDWLEDTDWLEEGISHPFTVRTSASIHDQKQFQIKLDYDRTLLPGDLRKVVNMEAYFFVPVSMGITSRTYSKEQFFSSLTNYLRIKTPRRPYWFEETASLSIPSADAYLNLKASTKERQAVEPLVIQDTKLFGCYLNTVMKSLQMLLLHQETGSQSGNPEFVKSFRKRLERLFGRIQIFRQKYVGGVQRFASLASPDVRKVFLLMDEYLSYRVESWLLDYLQHLEPLTEDWAVGLREYLGKSVEKEVFYRQRYMIAEDNQLVLSKTRGPQAQEQVQYRLGLLKKYVYQVLYLEQEIVRRDKLFLNFMAMIGAALAATFYGLATLQQMSLIHQAENFWRLAAMFVVGILAYVAKDRIKELSREYFFKKLRKYLPDLEYKIVYSYLDIRGQQENVTVGNLAQYMQFVGRALVPADILYLRDLESNFDLEPERQEEVFHFHRRFEMQPDTEDTDSHNVEHIKEVLRLDVSEYLNKMSDPKRSWQYWDLEKGIVKVDAPRVYHLNVVIRYTVTRFREDGTKIRHIEYQRLRLVMNKQGILRIDSVLEKGEIAMEEVL